MDAATGSDAQPMAASRPAPTSPSSGIVAPADSRDSAGGTSSGFGSQLASVPLSCPVLPAKLSARQEVHRKLVSVLVEEHPRALVPAPVIVAVCGMGGIGKSTLAALVLRDLSIRARFHRMAFVSVGRVRFYGLLPREPSC